MNKEETCLWGFAKNLAISPYPVKVNKECPKTFFVDGISTRVNKVGNPKPNGCVGYNTYYLYYRTEEDAKAAYDKFKKQQEEDALHSSRNYIEQQAVKKAFDKLKERLPECVDEGSEEHVLSQVEAYMEIENIIDEIYKELYGEDNNE